MLSIRSLGRNTNEQTRGQKAYIVGRREGTKERKRMNEGKDEGRSRGLCLKIDNKLGAPEDGR
jgi:hypothetical protein